MKGQKPKTQYVKTSPSKNGSIDFKWVNSTRRSKSLLRKVFRSTVSFSEFITAH